MGFLTLVEGYRKAYKFIRIWVHPLGIEITYLINRCWSNVWGVGLCQSQMAFGCFEQVHSLKHLCPQH